MNKSFTLIEILVVIIVIGILSAFILVGMNSITQGANITKSKTFSNSLRNSLLINLVSEWKLDGNASDSWGNNNGTWSGAGGSNTTANWRPESECISGQCLNFDGTDDTVSCGADTSLNTNNGITINTWIKATSLSSMHRVISKEGSFLFRPTSGSFCVYLYVDGAYRNFTSSIPLNNNIWYQLTFTYDSSTRIGKRYVNGELKDSTTLTGLTSYTIATSVNNLYIGGASGQFFGGNIDEATLYNSVLNSFKTKENYYSGINSLLLSKNIKKQEYIARINDFLANN